MIFADSHAHLFLVAEELGRGKLAAILDSYSKAYAEAELEGRPGPIVLDPGVDPGDLVARISLLDGGGGLPSFLRLAAGAWPSAENLAAPAASVASLAAAMDSIASRGIRVAAIGEGGLDYHHMDGSKAAQAELFEGQIALASGLGLPLIVHSRDAAADTLSLIERSRLSTPVIIHCFGYGGEEARAFLDLGCWISFAGNLTYKNSGALRAACALVPEDRLLLETDSPYMNPVPYRGKSATPLDIERTYAHAAELRGVGVPELAAAVSRNAHFLFDRHDLSGNDSRTRVPTPGFEPKRTVPP
jgi:TatD DNase family protein